MKSKYCANKVKKIFSGKRQLRTVKVAKKNCFLAIKYDFCLLIYAIFWRFCYIFLLVIYFEIQKYQ